MVSKQVGRSAFCRLRFHGSHTGRRLFTEEGPSDEVTLWQCDHCGDTWLELGWRRRGDVPQGDLSRYVHP